MSSFEPKIAAFLCNWCSYAGADLAGTSRMQYPSNVTVVRVPCSARVDATFIIKAFEKGADAVLVSGCHPGDCHYTSGNLQVRRRWVALVELLNVLGIDPARLRFSWVSASEGGKFVEVVKGLTEDVRALGPFSAYPRESMKS